MKGSRLCKDEELRLRRRNRPGPSGVPSGVLL